MAVQLSVAWDWLPCQMERSENVFLHSCLVRYMRSTLHFGEPLHSACVWVVRLQLFDLIHDKKGWLEYVHVLCLYLDRLVPKCLVWLYMLIIKGPRVLERARIIRLTLTRFKGCLWHVENETPLRGVQAFSSYRLLLQ